MWVGYYENVNSYQFRNVSPNENIRTLFQDFFNIRQI